MSGEVADLMQSLRDARRALRVAGDKADAVSESGDAGDTLRQMATQLRDIMQSIEVEVDVVDGESPEPPAEVES